MKQVITGILILSLSLIPAAGGAESPKADLVLHITGFSNDDGMAKVAVTNSAENFEENAPPFLGFNLKIKDHEVNRTVTVPYGEYAVKVYHDENGNDTLDKGLFGIPRERYGFSNNARGEMGPPAYDEARFTVQRPKLSLSIEVR